MLALEPYLEHLQAVPFVRSVKKIDFQDSYGDHGIDAIITIDTPTGPHRLFCQFKSTNISFALGAQAAAYAARIKNMILFAPVIAAGVADFLVKSDTNFVDLRGNCYLNLGGQYVARTQAERGRPSPQTGAPRLPSYFVLFTLVAEPALVAATVRALAEKAGVSRQPAVWMREQMVKLGIIVRGAKGYVWAPQGVKRALDLWLAGYATAVRPKMMIGTYRTQDSNPSVLESRIAPLLDGICEWRWGGGAASHRLTGYYRGERTVVHLVAGDVLEISKRVRAVPDPNGPLVLLRTPGPVATTGATADTVHPLLVYSELLVDGNERAREAAQELADRYAIARTP